MIEMISFVGGCRYNGLLFWPNEDDALGGWYQRFTSEVVASQTTATITLADSQALGLKPSASRDEFRKRTQSPNHQA
jgi:hypothetical protein